MNAADIMFVLAIAVAMTLLLAALCLSLGLGCRGARMFATLAAAIWCGGRLDLNFGPLLWGVAWLPLFLVGLVSTAAYIGLMVASRCITRTVAAHLDALAFHYDAVKNPMVPLNFRFQHRRSG